MERSWLIFLADILRIWCKTFYFDIYGNSDVISAMFSRVYWPFL